MRACAVFSTAHRVTTLNISFFGFGVWDNILSPIISHSTSIIRAIFLAEDVVQTLLRILVFQDFDIIVEIYEV